MAMRFCADALRARCMEARTMAKDPAAAEEITRLRDCVNDLVSIMALPAQWTGGEPAQIVSTVLDALLGR